MVTPPFDGAPALDDAMPDEEVLARAEAFDPTPAEQFVSWATGVGDCLVIAGCSCNGCATVAREIKAAKVMRLALEMIVAKSNPDEQLRLASSLCGGAISTLEHICKVAEQALRECS